MIATSISILTLSVAAVVVFLGRRAGRARQQRLECIARLLQRREVLGAELENHFGRRGTLVAEVLSRVEPSDASRAIPHGSAYTDQPGDPRAPMLALDGYPEQDREWLWAITLHLDSSATKALPMGWCIPLDPPEWMGGDWSGRDDDTFDAHVSRKVSSTLLMDDRRYSLAERFGGVTFPTRSALRPDIRPLPFSRAVQRLLTEQCGTTRDWSSHKLDGRALRSRTNR